MKSTAQLLILLTTTCALLGAGLWLWAQNTDSVVIESKESQNSKLQPVFNEIRWFPGKDRDVWMMNQSHFGRNPLPHQWERLAIVIDKTKSPMIARYYQIKPGELEWREDLINQRTEYRASCFICHNNGPRALRPQENSELAKLSWADKMKIAMWNLRIKTYGRIHFDPLHDEEDKTLNVHFRYHGSPHEDELKVPVCLKCHKEEGLFARGALHRQQIGTIEHMVKSGQMPPPGFSMSPQEKQRLLLFLRGGT
jgi:hypothetical protein